ncbi:MAG TPA: DEAD/DEAH box helicase [Myxococcota bacterium]
MLFKDLGLDSSLCRAVSELGYVEPTAVQQQLVPVVLAGGDAWASARTGSGKTAAYLLPLLQRLTRAEGAARTRTLRGLVLVPTRELAVQVDDEVARYARYLAPRLVHRVLVGGGSLDVQRLAMRGGVDLIVATPGRLLDFVDRGEVSLAQIEHFVLDEADRMLSLGFADELGRVLERLPARRQNVLVSATFGAKVQALADRVLVDARGINVDGGAMPDTSAILQRAIEVDAGKRTRLLRALIRSEQWDRVLVFVATQKGTDELVRDLEKADIASRALHGDQAPTTRANNLDAFAAGDIRVLVATDLAARGIDVVGLDAVVNWDLPRSSTDYVHRIGRTGRAGDSGVAVSFVTADNAAHFGVIERHHKLKVPRERVAGFEPTDVARPVLDVHGGKKGTRPSKKDKLRAAAAAAAKAQPKA